MIGSVSLSPVSQDNGQLEAIRPVHDPESSSVVLVQSLLGTVRHQVAAWQARLAYRHEWAEWSLYLLVVTGLLLWNGFDLFWPVMRWSLVLHLIAGALLFPLIILPFWLSHRSLLNRSRKPRLRLTGRLIELGLIAMVVTGFYLLFWGNPGHALGHWMHEIHLLLTLPLLPLVLWHAFRFSVLRLRRDR